MSETNNELTLAWPDDRRQELVELRDMLNDLRSLNNGSNFIGKIDRAIQVAIN